MSKRRGSDIGADWKLLVLDSKSGVQHVVNVCNPEVSLVAVGVLGVCVMRGRETRTDAHTNVPMFG